MAAGLRALGIRRGDHVAVLMGNSLEWVTFFYAAATVGAVTVPVNTRFKPDELAYCLKQADVKLLFLVDRFLKIDFVDMLRAVCPGVDRTLPDPAFPLLGHVIVLGSDVPAGAMTLEAMLAAGAPASAAAEEVRPDDVLLMQFTSGTTSYPKGVMLTHDNMLRNAAYVAERFDAGPATAITARAPSTTWPAPHSRCSPRLPRARACSPRPPSSRARRCA